MERTPTLTASQSRRVDEIAINELGIPGVVLMENAGINATAAVLDALENLAQVAPEQASVGVLCGGGHNGGDGYVIARHLSLWGVGVRVFAAVAPEKLAGAAAVNANIVRNMALAFADPTDTAALAGCDLLVDALLGTGISGDVRPHTAGLIDAVNGLGDTPVVAIDLHFGSGLQHRSARQHRDPGGRDGDVRRAENGV